MAAKLNIFLFYNVFGNFEIGKNCPDQEGAP